MCSQLSANRRQIHVYIIIPVLFCLVLMFLLKHFHPIISVSSSANLSRQSPEFTEQKILGDIVEGSGYYASVGISLSSGVFSRVLLIIVLYTY